MKRGDLSHAGARREIFARLGSRAKHALVLSEGLVTYLNEEEVGRLSEDLAAQKSFRGWVLDMMSPGLVKRMTRKEPVFNKLKEAGAPVQFAPQQGPDFFTPHGWKPVEVRSLLHTAAELKRLSFFMRLVALLPDAQGKVPTAPWGGVCLFNNTAP